VTLTIDNLTKSFGGEVALSGVGLDVSVGEIHALLGPNGSGKSTLIGCIGGRLAPDRGTMKVGNQRAQRFTPRSAFEAGTAIIYQQFSLIPTLSIADNIFLGSERTAAGGRIDRRQQSREAAKILSRFGVRLDPREIVGNLSVGEKQLVEIAKALRHDPKLLILDEPTAALGEREARLLGQQLKRLKDAGLAILYVTHLLSEVFEIADRVTILRDGHSVLDARIGEVSRDDLIKAISPGIGTVGATGPVSGDRGAEALLKLDGFAVAGVGPVDLSVGPGEVVGIFGLLGSGRSELLEGLFGIRRGVTGKARLEGVRGVRLLSDPDPENRLKAITLVAAKPSQQNLTTLVNLAADPAYAADPRIKAALDYGTSSIRSWLRAGDILSVLFSGLSYASILFLASLGLAIIFGLMGVINLAQGELIMVGAYATYFVQEALRVIAPGLLEFYIILALPFAFLVSAAVGLAMEVTVIRHLYRRPLITLLATWAVSLLLINSVRVAFGTQNLEFITPAYLAGGERILGDFIITWNRLFAILCALATFFLALFLLKSTRLGLYIRAVTANRDMAGVEFLKNLPANQGVQIAFDQGDVAAFHGHVRAGSHSDTHIGLGERWRIINAVAGHGDDAAFGLKFFDDF